MNTEYLNDLQYNFVPVYTDILADLETPVSVYLKLKNTLPSFLFESVEGGERIGRWSIVGINPLARVRLYADHAAYQILRDEADISYAPLSQILERICSQSKNPLQILDDFIGHFSSPIGYHGGLVGALSYDIVRFIEPITIQKPASETDGEYLLPGDLVIFDHLKKTLRIITYIYRNADMPDMQSYAQSRIDCIVQALSSSGACYSPLSCQALHTPESLQSWQPNFQASEFIQLASDLKEYILAGDIFQIVPSQRLSKKNSHSYNPLHLYRLLRSLNPSPYLFLVDMIDMQMIASSPEAMSKVTISTDGQRQAVLRPIAGTYRRGATAAEDDALAHALQNDPKEIAEHLMLVDLARNDLGRVAQAGTVRPNGDIMFVEKYSHVLHLVSEIICDIAPQVSIIDVIRATYPAGTLTGSPKVKAMQIINELEPHNRGYYAGCTGILGFDGTLNTAMNIRTIFIQNDEIFVQAGAGIVYDSVPQSEYQETINKMAAVIKVIDQAENV